MDEKLQRLLKQMEKSGRQKTGPGKLVKGNFIFPPKRRAENLLKILFKKNVDLVTLKGTLLVLY
jgi:hypothetical protein